MIPVEADAGLQLSQGCIEFLSSSERPTHSSFLGELPLVSVTGILSALLSCSWEICGCPACGPLSQACPESGMHWWVARRSGKAGHLRHLLCPCLPPSLLTTHPAPGRLCLATAPMAASPSNQPLDKSFSISRSQLERGSTPLSLYSLLPSLGDSFHPQTQLWPPGSHCCRASCWMVPLDSVRELGL